MKKIFLAVGLLIFVFGQKSATACSCFNNASPRGAYATADAVLVGTVTKVEPAKSDDEYEGEQIAHVKIEQPFKGLDGVTEIVLHQPGDNCTAKFSPNVRYLLYATYHEKEKTWTVEGCGRGGRVEDAPNDMLYLQALPDSANRSRISGVIEHYEDTPEKGFSHIGNVAGVKVTITGAKKSYDLYTDSNGVYEIYDLPAGMYTITPELPPGFKTRSPFVFGALDFSRKVPVKLGLSAKSDAGSDFVVSADVVITGKVFGSNNQIMRRVCLDLRPVDASKGVSPYFRIYSCTKEDGVYTMTDMAPGSYYVVLNVEGKRTGSDSYGDVYYPGVSDKDKATIINVTPGDHLENYDIHIQSQLPTVEIRGVTVYFDGRPAVGQFVNFRRDPSDEKTINIGQTETTDEQGQFTLRVLQGSKGWIRAFQFLYSDPHENCPEAEKWRDENPGVPQIESKPQRLEINGDVAGIKLVIPLPSCKRKEKK